MGLAEKRERFIVQFFYNLITTIMNYCQLQLQADRVMANLYGGSVNYTLSCFFV